MKKGGRVKKTKGFSKNKEKTSKQNEEKIMPGTMMMKRPMMKKGGKALKPVKPSQKGLKKLHKKVRNKMGYMKNGGKVK